MRKKHSCDRVIQGGEVVEVQRHGKTVAVFQRLKVSSSRSEVLRLLRDRGFTEKDSGQLQAAMDAA